MCVTNQARKRIDARVDGEVKAFLDPDKYKIYLEWRARLKGATETIKAKRERPDEDDRCSRNRSP